MLFFYLNKINSDHNLIYIIIRTIIIYFYAIFLIRFANRRFNIKTSFDFVLIIILGSVVSRAINGSSTLLQSLVGSGVLIFLHWLIAYWTFKSHRAGKMLKGESTIVICNGKVNWEVLSKNQITKEDIMESVRETMHHDTLENIKEARLERTGKLSFVLKK